MQAGDGPSATVSVLCVEDDGELRDSLSAALVLCYPGMTVYSAGNGADGLRLFREHHPEIVVTDISMPVMDGIQMSAEIKRSDPKAVIVAVTAVSDSKYLLRAIEIGINQYLLKPIDLKALLEAIGRHRDTILLKRQLAVQCNQIRMLSKAVQQSPSSVLITDANGVIEYVNPKFTEVSGYSAEEVIGQNPRLLKSGLTAPETYADLWRTITSGGVWQGELQNRKKNGDTYWVSMVVSALRDDDETVHYLAVREIITERKLAEQERESTIEFLHIVNACSGIDEMVTASLRFFKQKSNCNAVGIRLRDGEDYPYFKAQGFSEDFVRAESTLSRRDAGGTVIWDGEGNPIIEGVCGNVICGRVEPPDQYFTTQGSFWTKSTTDLLAASSEGDRHVCSRRRCAEEGFESVALIPLSIGTERLGLLQLNDARKSAFAQQDIDQWERLAGYLAIALLRFRAEVSLKQLNEELEQRITERTVSLETALREQESFSYSVSHDLRAPLRHINGYLTMLSDDFGQLLPAQAHRYLDRSRTASQSMNKLIDGLLGLSKVSRTSLAKENVSLSELASHACSALHEAEPQRCVEFVIKEGLFVRGDKSLLRQMMVNLLGNAWKYTAIMPTARIEFSKVVISDQEVFYIRDNGVGFDMAYSDKLFGEFQRLHGPEYEGTGIGLATVKRIVDRHGGRVWAESKPGKGATFYFTLP